MSDTIIVAIIAGGFGTAQTALLAYVALKQRRQAVDMQELAVNTNSIREALVDTTRTAAHAEGKLEGKAEQKAESGGLPIASPPKIP